MKKTPLLSVIVPIYNVESYLSRCVESILAQNVDSMEVILVDDGSKDSSGAVCDQYAAKDDRIRVIHKETAASAPPGMRVWISAGENTLLSWTVMTGSSRMPMKIC